MTVTPERARARVAATDWAGLAAELDTHGCAPTAPLLTPAECRDLTALYGKPELFRTTVDMARHRFGSGEYRYFTHDLPAPVAALRTLKSDVITGLTAGTEAALVAAEEQRWRTGGTHALIQVRT